jgi:hypothetical protein
MLGRDCRLAEFGLTNRSITRIFEMDLALRHRYRCVTLSAVTLSLLWMNVLMATTSDERPTTSTTATWNEAEVSAFLDYLLANKSRMGESGVFPQAVYNSAAMAIANHHTSGPPKTGKSCKSKWTTVCIVHS